MSASAIKAGGVFVEIGADPRQFFAALNKVNKAMANMGKSLVTAGTKIGVVGGGVMAPLVAASRQFQVFDDAIRATAAVSGATGQALKDLNDTARHLGATTSFTAVEVANLMTELGRAGFKPDEIIAMTDAVLDLARATGTDATRASGIMAASLRQFELGAGDAARVADVLTKAANSTFNTVESLGEALKYAGPVAKSLGMSLEDTVAILGVLGNVGIQGSEAGTALRRLSVISAGAGKELKDLFNVDNTDANGKLKPLVQILDEINTATKDMPVAERTKRMADAFGLLGITSANVLSQTAGGVVELAKQLQNAEGTAKKAAKEMDAGLGGALRIALSAVEGTALAIGSALAPSFISALNFVNGLATGLTDFVKKNESLVVNAMKAAAVLSVFGGSLVGLGVSLQVAAFGMGGICKAAAVAIAPLRLLAVSAMGISGAFASAVPGVVALASATGSAMVSAGIAVARFVAGAVGGLAAYIASTVAAATASVTNAVKSGVAWAASGLPGVTAFVAGAVGGLAAYLGAAAAAVAGSVASAAAVAAAWVAPLAPFLAISAAIAGVGALLYSLRGQIGSAFSGVSELVGQASEAIGGGFNKAASNGMAVLSDLATTATTTFNGIYEAISAGDLSGAMDVLWAGLQAGWLRGVEAIMGYVDSWVSTFQDTFTYLGTTIAQTWDGLWTGVSNSFNTFGAYLQGAFDNVINTVLKSWDVMEAAVRKSWNYVMSFIKKGYDLKKENEKVDSEMTARARQRELQRPGIAGREAKAREENKKRSGESQQRQAAMEAEAASIYQSRSNKNAENAAARRSATKAAENDLNTKVASQRETRARNAQAEDLGSRIQSATSVDQLRELNGELRALADNSRLTAEQEKKLSDALDDQTEKIVRQANETPTANQVVVMNNADAAGREASRSKAEAVGTFSSFALGGLGYGSSLAQMQLDELRKIEKNTKNREVGIVRD